LLVLIMKFMFCDGADDLAGIHASPSLVVNDVAALIIGPDR
jgi:hypothetical protein